MLYNVGFCRTTIISRVHTFIPSLLSLLPQPCPDIYPLPLKPLPPHAGGLDKGGESTGHPVLSDSATPRAVQSTGFSWPEYWSAQPFPPPGDLPNPGIEPRSPTLQGDSLPSEPPGKPRLLADWSHLQNTGDLKGVFSKEFKATVGGVKG